MKKEAKRTYLDDWCSNVQVTSKYTWLTFIPKSIFEQFRRTANFYFLVQAILMIVGQYTSLYQNEVTWYGTGATLVFVLIFTMIFQAKDDIARHSEDKVVNSRMTSYYTGSSRPRGAIAVKVGIYRLVYCQRFLKSSR